MLNAFRLNDRRGFAIGTILLAVVLIAAIVSAIAIASRGSTGSADREQNRLDAGSLMQLGTGFKNAFDRAAATGNDIRLMTLGTPIEGPFPAPEVEANCGIAMYGLAACNNTPNCIFGTDAFMAEPTGLNRRMFCGVTGAPDLQFQLRRDFIIAGVGGGQPQVVVLLGGLSRPICQHINNMANGIPTTQNLPTIPDNHGASILGLNPGSDEDEDVTLPNTVAAGWQEGCFVHDFYGSAFYFRVMN